MLVEEMPENIWNEYSLTKDIGIRNCLVSKYLYLVKIIVCKLFPVCTNHVEYGDFFNYGILGLIDAIEKFDYTKGIKFQTYGSIRIRGAIMDNLREHDWVSTNLRKKLKKVERAYEYLECKNGHSPTEEEVAKYLDIDEKELKGLLVDSHASKLIYLDELQNPTVNLNVTTNNEPEECYEKKEIKELLFKQMGLLPSKEKAVITLYYFNELRLKQIGSILGVSESRVSQIHSKAITKLKTALM